MKKSKLSYDFALTLGAVGLMFLLSLLCLASTFYFKWAGLGHVPPVEKQGFEELFNRLAAPVLAGLLLVLAICVPKRLLSTRGLNRLALFLGVLFLVGWFYQGWRLALLLVLIPTALLQILTLVLLCSGKRLRFCYEGFWAQLGSCLLHLGLILFALTVLLISYFGFWAPLFWTSAVLITSGLICSWFKG